MSSLFPLLFAPSFLLLIRLYDFKTITLIYILLTVTFLLFSIAKKKKREDFVISGIYLLLLSFAFFMDNFEFVKFIPVFTSITFFSIFTYAAYAKKEIIYKFTKKFYKKEMSDAEILFLKNGDKFWAVTMFIYTFIQVLIVYFGNDTLWAIYSSIGWYIYFVIALVIQILYGKLYAIKLYS